ncbi:MAG: hypothetical protein ACYCWE_02545 [Eubacteriales bacterium]
MKEPSEVKEAFDNIEVENYAFRRFLKTHAKEKEPSAAPLKGSLVVNGNYTMTDSFLKLERTGVGRGAPLFCLINM